MPRCLTWRTTRRGQPRFTRRAFEPSRGRILRYIDLGRRLIGFGLWGRANTTLRVTESTGAFQGTVVAHLDLDGNGAVETILGDRRASWGAVTVLDLTDQFGALTDAARTRMLTHAHAA